MDSHVLVGVPCYGQIAKETVVNGVFQASNRPGLVEFNFAEGSALGFVFNRIWVTALGMPAVTHFVMLHADVVPEPGYVDKLLEIADREKADIVSAVIPIKTTQGATSTAIGDIGDPWKNKKRFTMREIMDLPPTFDAERAGFSGDPLLVNTGCLLVDIRNQKFRAIDGNGNMKFYFTLQDRIRVSMPNVYAEFIPEDWNFSRLAFDAGMKVVATREIRVEHMGKYEFPNDCAWGD